MSVWLTLATVPTGMPSGKIEVRFRLLPAGGDERVALDDRGRLRHLVEDDRAAGVVVAEDPGGARLRIDHRDEARLVGDQLHLRAAREDPRHDTDEEAARRDDRVVDRDAVAPADSDDHALVELAGRLRDDARRQVRGSPAGSSARRRSSASAAGRGSLAAASGAGTAATGASRSRPSACGCPSVRSTGRRSTPRRRGTAGRHDWRPPRTAAARARPRSARRGGRRSRTRGNRRSGARARRARGRPRPPAGAARSAPATTIWEEATGRPRARAKRRDPH